MSASASIGPAQEPKKRPRPSGLIPWKPGQSGNPKGRAPALVDINALAREHGPKCIEVAAKLLASKDERIRLAAAIALLDRGFGKPAMNVTSDIKSVVTIEHGIDAPERAHETREEWIARRRAELEALDATDRPADTRD